MTSDLRYAVRVLARSRGTTAVAALALALGIGANTAIFSVVQAALLRPLPYPDSHRLLWVWNTNPTRNLPIAFMAYWLFGEWREQMKAFESTSAYFPQNANLSAGGGDPESVSTLQVNASFFSMVGVRPRLGRDFLPEEDRPGAARVAIITHELWQRRFGSDRGVLGRPVVLDAQPCTVVGVLPPKFQFGRRVDVYVPLARSTARGQGGSVGAFARLRRNVTTERAQAELNAIYRRLEKTDPFLKEWSTRIYGAQEFVVRDIRLTLWVLLGAVGLVLLIACANVANLLLARAGARRREIAMRVALGAGRWRLLRQLLIESTLLGLAGGALGLLLALGGVRLFRLLGPAQFPMLDQTRIDLQVLAFTLVVSLLTGILFGLAPALAGIRVRVYENLKEGGRAAGESVRRNRARSALVVVEVALALLLMTGALLMIRSLWRLQQTNPGFTPDGVLTAGVTLPEAKYTTPEMRGTFYRQVLERVRAMPGVSGAGMTNLLPLGGSNVGVGISIEGQPAPRPGEVPIVYQRIVDPNYFQVMRIPLERGRLFTERDTGQPRVAVINDVMARRHWPGQDALGRRFGNPRNWTTVVGVVGGVRHMSLAQEPDAEYYEPFPQGPRPAMSLVVRTPADPLRLAPALRQAVREADRDLPVSRISTMAQYLDNSIASRRFSVVLLAIFAGVALALAGVGIYGVISFSVTRRTQEIGVRMALGASRRAVLGMVIRQAAALALAGIAIGIGGGLALARVIRTLLYGISPADPLTLAAVSVVLLAVAGLASYLPARRAARVDPIVALRYE